MHLHDPADMSAAELRRELLASGYSIPALASLQNWQALAAAVNQNRPASTVLTQSELLAIERNYTRLAAIGDRGQTLDMFASGHATEEFTLCGETIRPVTTCAKPDNGAQLSLL